MKMTYLNKYRDRVNFWGCNETEQFKNSNIANFKAFLEQTPHKLSIGEDLVGATIFKRSTDFSEEYYYLLTEINRPMSLGAVLTDPEGRRWLVAADKSTQTPSYNRYQIINMDNRIEWHDKQGVLKSADCLVVGSLKSQLKEIFKTSQQVQMPQTNGQLLIIMPNMGISMDTRLILGTRAWKVVGYDDLSAPGVTFLSLEQDKIDKQKDDLDNKIAENAYDEWSIEVHTDTFKKLVGDEFIIPYTAYKNGIEVDEPVEFYSNSNLVSIANGTIKAAAKGFAQVEVRFINNHEISTLVNIEILDEIVDDDVSYKIIGSSSIKWGETKRYIAQKFINGTEVASSHTITLVDTNSLVKGKNRGSYYDVTAKLENKIGNIIIKATFDENPQVIVEKVVYINSLWS